VFEFLETKSRVAGTSLGGRIPGKININTIWDPETFQALCDAQASNNTSFTAADVSSIYTAVTGQRTKGVGGTPSATDQPFIGMAAGTNAATAGTQYPNGTGMANTLLAPGGAQGRFLFEGSAGATHPYLRAMLLNKIYNNVTTRSNTYAVWLTTGFFTVAPTGTNPAQLQAEWGLSQGINIRHHMFAVIDRTQIGMPSTSYGSTGSAVTSTGSSTITITGAAKMPSAGDVVQIDSGLNIEAVVVRSVSGTSFTATFNKTHASGVTVVGMTAGNPGPQPNFSAKDNSAVIPYYSIID
jgi:hypothetical protein